MLREDNLVYASRAWKGVNPGPSATSDHPYLGVALGTGTVGAPYARPQLERLHDRGSRRIARHPQARPSVFSHVGKCYGHHMLDHW